MKLDFGETREEKEVRLSQWHKHFALFPVKITDHDYRWLETVWRKGKLCYNDIAWSWEYKAFNDTDEMDQRK